jgi:hypothetical protein
LKHRKRSSSRITSNSQTEYERSDMQEDVHENTHLKDETRRKGNGYDVERNPSIADE